MLNTAKITFRCKYGRKNLFTPEYLHDVLGMRQHPDYEELDAEGNVVVQQHELVQRPLMSVDNTKTLAPSAPKAKKKR